jgi:hypothetical protein
MHSVRMKYYLVQGSQVYLDIGRWIEKTHQYKHEELKCYYPEGLQYSIALSVAFCVGF